MNYSASLPFTTFSRSHSCPRLPTVVAAMVQAPRLFLVGGRWARRPVFVDRQGQSEMDQARLGGRMRKEVSQTDRNLKQVSDG